MWKIGEFSKLLGVSNSTLRRWESENKLIPERTLGDQRIYTEKHLILARNLKTGISPTKNIIYCRVSSSNQKDDLASQVKAMESFCLAQGVEITDTLIEIGGGLNFKRKKFLQIIKWAITGEINTIYIAHKDRLCRFGFELVEEIVSWGGGKLIIANAEILSPHEELTQDLLAIIHVFSCRLYGLRSYKNKIKEIIETVDNSKEVQ